MKATPIDGSALAQDTFERIAAGTAEFERRTGRKPRLATVLVGDDPASITYVRMKANRCERVGIESERVELPASTSTEELVRTVTKLSSDDRVNGILLAPPMPGATPDSALRLNQ